MLDETGRPISDAQVGITFLTHTDWNGSKTKSFYGDSDKDGLFSATHMSLYKTFVGVTKDGYYKSHYESRQGEIKKLTWQPWNPTIELVLRKKVNPVPLYAKRFFYLKLPLEMRRIGFDIQKGDWVKPYGKGSITDIIIEYNREHQDFSNFRWVLNVTMNSTNDGFYAITEKEMYTNSIFKLPYLAPENKYTLTNILYIVDVKNGRRTTNTILPVDNYFFRFRTKPDDNNNVENCYYGKILDFDNQPAMDSANLSFFMYYNPILNNRNLEFNVESNLYENLKRSEEIRIP